MTVASFETAKGQSMKRVQTIVAMAAAMLLLAGPTAQAPAFAQGASASPAPIADLAVVAPVKACAELTGVDITAIGGAGSAVKSATETTNNGVAVCAVEGNLAPTIGFRVLLPTKTWAQRYLQTGCGGLCGNISTNVGAAAGFAPLTYGAFVIASTDMGHTGGGGEFGQDPQKRADFAYRGVHLTAVTSKKLIAAFYGRKEAYSYFSGCSDGGREALMEVQRYPEDFNGVIAGAPAMNFQVQNSVYHAWQARSNTGADGKPILVAERLPILHAAIVAACDKLDGLEDGVLTDPRLCKADAAIAQCAAGGTDTAKCLTSAEVGAARKLYDGPRDPTTGDRLTIGGPQPGSELSWAGVFVPRPGSDQIFSERIALDSLRNVIFATNPAPTYGLGDLAFTRATFETLKAQHALNDTTNPDIAPFAARGGKLILWHGWSDPHISPINTIAYHEAVEATLGKARAQSFERLYMLPGVYHCNGGEGPSSVDMLSAVMAWVEKGVAPGAILASPPAPRPPGAAGGPPAAAGPPAPVVTATRPVYPFPAVAKYVGGDANRPTSFAAGPALTPAGTPNWLGRDFYRAYAPKTR